MATSTADVLDAQPGNAHVCDLVLRQFGGVGSFAGEVSTVRCFEDNVVVKRHLSEPGRGRVLVVDGGGSLRVALIGDMVAGLAAASGWAGIVVNGCVRDSATLCRLDVGIKALGTNPRPSGKAGAGEVDVPVEFGGITFRPGAMLYSDDDGVVVVDRPLGRPNRGAVDRSDLLDDVRAVLVLEPIEHSRRHESVPRLVRVVLGGELDQDEDVVRIVGATEDAADRPPSRGRSADPGRTFDARCRSYRPGSS